MYRRLGDGATLRGEILVLQGAVIAKLGDFRIRTSLFWNNFDQQKISKSIP
jgi:hypothetical protein